MKEMLEILNTITPTWAVSLAAFIVFISYNLKLYRARGHRWEVVLSDSAVVVNYFVVAFLYALFWYYDVSIDVRGPLVRFALITLFIFDAMRVWWQK